MSSLLVLCDSQNIVFSVCTVGTLLECLTHILLTHRAWGHTGLCGVVRRYSKHHLKVHDISGL